MMVPASERPPDILISISGSKQYVVRDVVTIGSAGRGIRAKQKGKGGGRRTCELTLRRFVVFAQFDDFVNVLTSKGLLDDDNIALERLVNWRKETVEILTSSSNGYPRSMIAFLLTSRAGILVFPFFGNSDFTLTVVTLSLLVEDAGLMLRTLPLWLLLSLLRLLRFVLIISRSRTRSGYLL
jgi:hypothetical protein